MGEVIKFPERRSDPTGFWTIADSVCRKAASQPCTLATLLAGFTLSLVSCGDTESASRSIDLMRASNWTIGPVIDGKNMSSNMPEHPTQLADGSFAIDIPYPSASAGHAHYVTIPYGPLAGKSRITMRYRVEMADGVKIVPKCCDNYPSILALFFQRKGDNWSGRGSMDGYRWYSSFRFDSPITAGEHELSAGLDEEWTGVETFTKSKAPAFFDAALKDTARIGFVLGGGDGFGHGVYATGPARIVVTGFSVE